MLYTRLLIGESIKQINEALVFFVCHVYNILNGFSGVKYIIPFVFLFVLAGCTNPLSPNRPDNLCKTAPLPTASANFFPRQPKATGDRLAFLDLIEEEAAVEVEPTYL